MVKCNTKLNNNILRKLKSNDLKELIDGACCIRRLVTYWAASFTHMYMDSFCELGNYIKSKFTTGIGTEEEKEMVVKEFNNYIKVMKKMNENNGIENRITHWLDNQD